MFCELKSNPERCMVSLDTDDIEKLLESGSFETDYGEMLLYKAFPVIENGQIIVKIVATWTCYNPDGTTRTHQYTSDVIQGYAPQPFVEIQNESTSKAL